MNRLKKLLATAIWISIAQTLQAQEHCNVWFRGTLSLPVGEKFKVDNELQHRRQNGFNNMNLFDKNLMFTYRSWIHYQYNEDIKFSISPFAYFSHYRIISNEKDESSSPINEIRFSMAMELQHVILKKLHIIDRNALEYRMFNNSQSNITRFRARLGFRYDFTEKIKLSIYDELILNLTGVTSYHFFDHDQLGFNLEYSILKKIKIDIGYIYAGRLPLTSREKFYENNIFLNFTYQVKK